MIAQQVVWDSTTWLILGLFASGITLIGAVIEGWQGVAKAWGFVLFLIVLVIMTSDRDPNEVCNYDFAGNEYCTELPPP